MKLFTLQLVRANCGDTAWAPPIRNPSLSAHVKAPRNLPARVSYPSWSSFGFHNLAALVLRGDRQADSTPERLWLMDSDTSGAEPQRVWDDGACGADTHAQPWDQYIRVIREWRARRSFLETMTKEEAGERSTFCW